MREGLPMSDPEQLVQRFLDQELSADERLQFVVRLGRDESLRQRVIAMERLTLGASRLPRPVVPATFVSSVMNRIPDRHPAVVDRPSLWHRLWAPRPLQWNFASAALACAALLLVGGIAARGFIGRPSVLEPSSTVLVRLVIVKPDATTVAAAGDFNGWNPASTPLEEVSSGAWAVTLALEPGRYEYMFVVDGQEWIADPFAVEQNDDGFGSRNAVLEVREPLGNQPMMDPTTKEPAPTLREPTPRETL
jgi:hypothetical protein